MRNNRVYPPSVQAGIPKIECVPNGWSVKRFGDLLKVVSRPADVDDNTEYQLVNAKRSRGGIVARERLLGREIKTKTQFFTETDDFLISRRQIVHGACGIVPQRLHGSLVSNEYSTLRTNKHLDLGFLRYLMHSIYFQQTCFHSSVGVTVEKLIFRLEQWLNEKLAVPTLLEQRKIADILSTWDQAIEKTDRLIAAKRKRKQTLMRQLLTGEMRFADNTTPAPFVTRSGFFERKLGPLPKDWQVIELPKCVWFQEGPGVQTHQFTTSGVKLFNGSNIQSAGITLGNTNRYISTDEACGRYAHFLADAGDLVIASSGIAVDKFDEKIAFLEEEHLPLCMNTSTIRFKSTCNDADIRYLRFFMMTALFKNQIRRQITGSAQLNFGPTHLKKCVVALPPIDEQKTICECLGAAEQEIVMHQRRVEAMSEQRRGLLLQLLTGKVRVKVDAEMVKG